MLEGNGFEYERPGGFAGKIIVIAMLAAFSFASMITTYSFFAQYAPRIGNMIHAGYAGIVAGVLGWVLFDLAGLGWTALRAYHANTVRQYTIATIAAIITIGLALAVSGLYVILSTDLIIGIYDDTGALTLFGEMIQIGGVAVMASGFVFNFAAIAAYVNMGAGITDAIQKTQIRAAAQQGHFIAEQRRAELTIAQALERIGESLPDVARAAGERERDRFLREHFDSRPSAEAEGAEGARKNGRPM